jgi:hypothetical protein
MRRSMHIGSERPLRLRAVAENAFVTEEIFNPDAAKTDGNPFPEELKETLDYNSMTVEELKALLRARGLEVTGKKAELVARLLDADTPSEEAVEAEEVVPSEEAATSDEGVSENNGTDSGIEQSLGE